MLPTHAVVGPNLTDHEPDAVFCHAVSLAVVAVGEAATTLMICRALPKLTEMPKSGAGGLLGAVVAGRVLRVLVVAGVRVVLGARVLVVGVAGAPRAVADARLAAWALVDDDARVVGAVAAAWVRSVRSRVVLCGVLVVGSVLTVVVGSALPVEPAGPAVVDVSTVDGAPALSAGSVTRSRGTVTVGLGPAFGDDEDPGAVVRPADAASGSLRGPVAAHAAAATARTSAMTDARAMRTARRWQSMTFTVATSVGRVPERKPLTMPSNTADVPRPWPDLDRLDGVPEAVEAAREAIARVRRLPAHRRGWPTTSAAAAVRAARASAMLDGGSAVIGTASDASPQAESAGMTPSAGFGNGCSDGRPGDAWPEGTVDDPILAGALRACAAVGELADVWRRAPLQALARLHTLAAADLTGADDLGRPRPDPAASARLASLADVVAHAPWSGPVLAAVVHGELLAVHPFGVADGVVARAAARLAMVSSGVDPHALTVPEVGHLRREQEYRSTSAAYASGRPEAVAAWIVHVCDAMQRGAREAASIARAAGQG